MFSLFLILIYALCFMYADEECKRNFSVRKNSIILTKASQSKGASFIHKQVVSMFGECFSLCCSNAECTVAVYENKVNHICFMFNCKEPNICLFTDHEDYISMLYTPDQNNKKPNLSIQQPVDRNKEHARPSMDAALGETCGTLRKCGPANSMCTSLTCICQIGYIGRGGLCVRSLCPKPEMMFQCMDVSKSPFCIALYDQCNGISECGDGSDEVNCEPNQYRRPVFNDTPSSQPAPTNPRPKMKSPQMNAKVPLTHNHQMQGDHKEHPIRSNQKHSHQNQPTRKTGYSQTKKYRKSNPIAENQLLLLEAKNKPPKYSPQHNYKIRQPYQKVSIAPEANNRLYEKHQYAKLKSPSYPSISKADEYYQKGSPDSQDVSQRWNNADSNSNDYEYQPSVSSNSRDSTGSDWDPEQYPDSVDTESPGKYSQDRGNYVYYPQYDEDSYPKPRGRYISDNDRYRPKYSSNNGYEPSMDYSTDHKESRGNRHQYFVNIPNKVDHRVSISTTISSDRKTEKLVVDDIDSRNINEWNTAVIALSLGLLLTAGLLVAVGFKMRSWRRRLKNNKKGKCLTTDEGDYLINGMYL